MTEQLRRSAPVPAAQETRFVFASIYESATATGPLGAWFGNTVTFVEMWHGERSFSITEVESRIIAGKVEHAVVQVKPFTTQSERAYIGIFTHMPSMNGTEEETRNCENQIDGTCAALACLYGFQLFGRQSYRGWLFTPAGGRVTHPLRDVNPISIWKPGLIASINDMRHTLTEGGDDISTRFTLMARFLSKAMLMPPSEERFILLYTLLEIFPMRGSRRIELLDNLLCKHLHKSVDDVRRGLGTWWVKHARDDLIHNGQLSNARLRLCLPRLEDMCIVVMRSMSGLPCEGLCETHFEMPFSSEYPPRVHSR